MSRINKFLRHYVNRKNRKRLINKDFSLLANNCNGAFILHDLGLQFRSPFVNLWMKPQDFIKYCENIEFYKDIPLEFETNEEYGYPVANLEDVKIYFQHYKTKEEARNKWEERSQRINLDNLFIMMTDRDGCTYEDLKKFENMERHTKKVVFTHKEYPEFKAAYYIPGFEDEECVGDCWKFRNKLSGYKIYDIFPYVRWFNEGKFKEDKDR